MKCKCSINAATDLKKKGPILSEEVRLKNRFCEKKKNISISICGKRPRDPDKITSTAVCGHGVSKGFLPLYFYVFLQNIYNIGLKDRKKENKSYFWEVTSYLTWITYIPVYVGSNQYPF